MNLSTLLFLARRDLFKNVRVLLLVLLAVGSGSMAVIPLNGLMSGLTGSLTAQTVDVSIGDVVVTPPKNERAIDQAQSATARLADTPGAQAATARIVTRAMAWNGELWEPAGVRGVDPLGEKRVTTIADYIVEGRFLTAHETDAVVVGRKLAHALQLRVGQRLRLLLSGGDEGRPLVVGVYDTGLRDLDSGVYVPLRSLQGLLGMGDQATEIVVRLDDPSATAAFISRLRGRWKAEGWQSRVSFVQALQANADIVRQIVVLLSILAAGISTAVLMYTNVEHRTRVIGILKAIGAEDGGVLRLFVLEGFLLGVGGALVGGALGSSICVYLAAHPIHATMGVSEGNIHAVAIAAAFSWSLLVAPAVSAIAIATSASFYPAWRAARTNIVEAIWHG